MKYYLITIFSIVLFGCSHSDEIEEYISNHEKDLSLVAPDGAKIAESISYLKKEISAIIAERSEMDQGFSIKNIEYAQVDNGYLAIINFVTDDNTQGAMVKTNINLEIGEGLATKRINNAKTIKSREEVKIEVGGYTHYVWCEDTSSCQCKPKVEDSNGNIKVTCPGNNNCTCKIKGMVY